MRIFIILFTIPFLMAKVDIKKFTGWSNVCLGADATPIVEQLQLDDSTFIANSVIGNGISLKISWSGNWVRNCDSLVFINIKETTRSAVIISPFTQIDFENGNLNKEAVLSQLESFISIRKAQFIVKGNTVLKIMKGTNVRTALVELR